ncbi:hypothetical protein ABKN59_008526 [Abortiporus biennis]
MSRPPVHCPLSNPDNFAHFHPGNIPSSIQSSLPDWVLLPIHSDLSTQSLSPFQYAPRVSALTLIVLLATLTWTMPL